MQRISIPHRAEPVSVLLWSFLRVAHREGDLTFFVEEERNAYRHGEGDKIVLWF